MRGPFILILDNYAVHQTHTFRFSIRSLALWGKVCFGIALIVCSQLALSQVNQSTKPNQTTKKVVTPQKGIQVNQRASSKSVNSGAGLQSRSSAEQSQSLTDPGTEEYSQFDAVPDFQVQRGCIKRGFRESNLPARIGINDPEFLEYFKNQTGRFFDSASGPCIPYVVAFGKRGRFESLSIMNGPNRNEKSQILTFTASGFGGYLVQEENLATQMQFWTELFIPLQEVLYDPQRLGDKLPV